MGLLSTSHLMNMSRKLMKANSMRAVKTAMKHMMTKTSRAVAYATYIVNLKTFFSAVVLNFSNTNFEKMTVLLTPIVETTIR